MCNSKKSVSISILFLVLVALFLYQYKNTNEPSSSLRIKALAFTSPPHYLKNCLNKVAQIHDYSLWTLLTDGSDYALSACKLLKSIRKHTRFSFDAFVLELATKPINEALRKKLTKAGWRMCRVDRIPPRDESGTFPRFRDQFVKLILWRMTEYTSCVYLDSDCFAVNDISQMFQMHEKLNNGMYKLAVSRDIFAGQWKSTFNMGVFAIKPNESEYQRLLELKNSNDFKFQTDQAEQGFLNEVYRNQWFEIGFEYNANIAVYSQKRKEWDEKEKGIRLIRNYFCLFDVDLKKNT